MDPVLMVGAWAGVSDWQPAEGEVVPLTGAAGIGWDWDGENFIDNRPPAEEFLRPQ